MVWSSSPHQKNARLWFLQRGNPPLNSREKEFLEQLEHDFYLEVVDDAQRGEPLPTSKDLGTRTASDRIAAERDVYILLGTRRRSRTDQNGRARMEKWRRQLC